MTSSNNDQSSMVKCPACEATWINGQLFWSTGAQGRDIDLAGLVCNMLERVDPVKAKLCINSCKGNEGGQTWEGRLTDLKKDIEKNEKE